MTDLEEKKRHLLNELLLGGLADGADVGSGLTLVDVTADRANKLLHKMFLLNKILFLQNSCGL